MIYLKWNGGDDAGYFTTYDKEKWENVKFKLGDFNIVDVCYTISGWDDSNNCHIYSNDIKSFVDENFTVRSAKGGAIAEGKYKEIKEEINDKWAKLHIKVVGNNGSGDDFSFTLKGMNYYNLSEVLKEKPKALKVKKVVDDKKGAVKFKSIFFEPTYAVATSEDVPF